MKICVIFNPAARGERAAAFRERLGALSERAVLKPTYAPGSARAQAAGAVADGFEVLVAAGGDGTVNEVLNGLADAPDGLARVRLGVLPLGTMNVLARELKIPFAFEESWRLIESGVERIIDLPEAEFTAGGQPERRCFAQLAGAGLDARAIELVNWDLKKRLGPLAYVAAGLKAMTQARPGVIASAEQAGAMGELVLLGNGRCYGGSFTLFPEARVDDGLLDVTVFPRVNWATLARGAWGMLSNRIWATTEARTFQASSVTLTSETPVTFQLDGENAGRLPATFRVRPRALRVLAPAA
jgi:YegS/Rv2252/BmrU family lipid kinase